MWMDRAQEGNEYDNCVYRTDLEAKAKQLILNEDIVDDPTLSKRNVAKCENPKKQCPNKEVVTFYHVTNDQFSLIYCCTKCAYAWRMTGKDETYDIASESDEDEK